MIRKLPTLSEGGESTPDESQGDVFPSGLNNLVPKFKVGKKVEKKVEKREEKEGNAQEGGFIDYAKVRQSSTAVDRYILTDFGLPRFCIGRLILEQLRV